MRKIDSITDEMSRVVTYEFSNGQRIRIHLEDLTDKTAAEYVRIAGFGHLLPIIRLPVAQNGRFIGTMAPDFDPFSMKSKSPLYIPRPRDFVLISNVWVASGSLGSGDFEAIPGFMWGKNASNP